MMIAVTSRNKSWAELYFFTKATDMKIEGSGITAETIAKMWYKGQYETFYAGNSATPVRTDMVCFRKGTKQHLYLLTAARDANKVWNLVLVGSAWNTTHGLIDMPDEYEKYIRFAFGLSGAAFSRFYTYMKHKLNLAEDRMPTLAEGNAHYKDFEMAEKFNKVI
jgi:hypothetical protein